MVTFSRYVQMGQVVVSQTATSGIAQTRAIHRGRYNDDRIARKIQQQNNSRQRNPMTLSGSIPGGRSKSRDRIAEKIQQQKKSSQRNPLALSGQAGCDHSSSKVVVDDDSHNFTLGCDHSSSKVVVDDDSHNFTLHQGGDNTPSLCEISKALIKAPILNLDDQGSNKFKSNTFDSIMELTQMINYINLSLPEMQTDFFRMSKQMELMQALPDNRESLEKQCKYMREARNAVEEGFDALPYRLSYFKEAIVEQQQQTLQERERLKPSISNIEISESDNGNSESDEETKLNIEISESDNGNSESDEETKCLKESDQHNKLLVKKYFATFRAFLSEFQLNEFPLIPVYNFNICKKFQKNGDLNQIIHPLKKFDMNGREKYWYGELDKLPNQRERAGLYFALAIQDRINDLVKQESDSEQAKVEILKIKKGLMGQIKKFRHCLYYFYKILELEEKEMIQRQLKGEGNMEEHREQCSNTIQKLKQMYEKDMYNVAKITGDESVNDCESRFYFYMRWGQVAIQVFCFLLVIMSQLCNDGGEIGQTVTHTFAQEVGFCGMNQSVLKLVFVFQGFIWLGLDLYVWNQENNQLEDGQVGFNSFFASQVQQKSGLYFADQDNKQVQEQNEQYKNSHKAKLAAILATQFLFVSQIYDKDFFGSRGLKQLHWDQFMWLFIIGMILVLVYFIYDKLSGYNQGFDVFKNIQRKQEQVHTNLSKGMESQFSESQVSQSKSQNQVCEIQDGVSDSDSVGSSRCDGATTMRLRRVD